MTGRRELSGAAAAGVATAKALQGFGAHHFVRSA
jgi:hypothetical protein